MAITKEQLIKAMKGSQGLITYVAKKLGCSRKHVYALMEQWPEAQEARDDEREQLKDYAEAHLIAHLNRGSKWAIDYVLSRLARDRGYGSKLELGGMDGGPIPVAFVPVQPKKKAAKKTTKKTTKKRRKS